MSQPPFPNTKSKLTPGPWTASNNMPRLSKIDSAIEATTFVVSHLQTIGSASGLPFIHEAAGLAVRIFNLIRDVRANNSDYKDLASDACGLVYTIVFECDNIRKDGQDIPKRIQDHTRQLVENLRDIEIFTRERVKRGLVKKFIYRSRDLNDIARFRTLLRQSLDIFDVQTNISIQQNIIRVMGELKQQREEMRDARIKQDEERRRAEEDLASRMEILRVQEEDRKEERDRYARRFGQDHLILGSDESKEIKNINLDTKTERMKADVHLQSIRMERDFIQKERDDLADQLRRCSPSPQPYPQPNPQLQPQPYPHQYPQPFSPASSPPGTLYPYSQYPQSPIFSSQANISVGVYPGGAPFFAGVSPAHVTNWNSGNVNHNIVENVGNDNSVYNVTSPRKRRAQARSRQGDQ